MASPASTWSNGGAVEKSQPGTVTPGGSGLRQLDEKWARWIDGRIRQVRTGSGHAGNTPGASTPSAPEQSPTSVGASPTPEIERHADPAMPEAPSTFEQHEFEASRLVDADPAMPGASRASHWVSTGQAETAPATGPQGANLAGASTQYPAVGTGPGPDYGSSDYGAPSQMAPSKPGGSNNRVLAGIGVALVAVLVLLGMVAAASGSSTITVNYSLDLDDSCYSTSYGYSDINSSTQVEVVDGSGTLLGSSYLGSGTSGGYDSCEYSTTLTVKSSSDGLYRVTAGNSNRGYLNFDESDLVNDTLTVHATLG